MCGVDAPIIADGPALCKGVVEATGSHCYDDRRNNREGTLVNQIFRINVGPETLQGRLQAVRVGKGYSCVFHISGVAYVEGEAALKIWIGSTEADTLFWTGEWDSAKGLWVVTVSQQATETVATRSYALTMTGDDGTGEGVREYIAGQGPFTVYDNIAAGGGEGGEDGESFGEQLAALDARILVLEQRFEDLATLGMFDGQNAYDHEMRTQIETITNKLRGTTP